MINRAIVLGMINAIIWINNRLFPFSIIIPTLLGILFLIGVASIPKHRTTLYFNLLIGFCYFYAGFPLLFSHKQLGIHAFIGGSVLLLFSLMFFAWSADKKHKIIFTKNKVLKICGMLLIICGTVLYPIVEYLTGFSWPGVAVFGMECPTTIAVIGLLISTFGNSSKWLMLILCINASFTGTSVAVNGAVFDWTYAAAGYIGLIVLAQDFIRKRRSAAAST